MTDFDPVRWLHGFADIGGGYTLSSDGRLTLYIDNCDGEQLAHVMAQVVGKVDRQLAIKSTIQRRQCGEGWL